MVEEPRVPLLTGTSPDRVPPPPARCRRPASVEEPPSEAPRKRPLVRVPDPVLPPSRMRNPAVPLVLTPSSNRGRLREVTLESPLPLFRAPVVARLVDLPLKPSASVILVRVVMASR